MGNEATSPKVSVIIPVYKVEKYLRDCVESVLAQSFTGFELILVDDGSPDKSGEICDELAKKDARIRVFHQANGGVTSARRLGVENARGEWITFLDSDDLLPRDALKILIDEATDEVDWIQGIMQEFEDGETPKEEARTGNVKSFDLIGTTENMLLHHPFPWGKIVRKKLFSPNVLDIPREISHSEDTLMNLRLIANRPRKGKEIDKVVYLYRRGVATAMTSSHLRTESYILRCTRLFLAELRKITTPSNRERIATTLAQYLRVGITYILIVHGLPIKFPRRLATLMRRGAKSNPRIFFTYLCLSVGRPGIAQTVAKICHFLHGVKVDARGKTLLE